MNWSWRHGRPPVLRRFPMDDQRSTAMPLLLTGMTLVVVALVAVVTGCGSGSAKADTTFSFPPASLAAFRAFAATGEEGTVHPVGTSSEGQRSCPDTTIYVTVSPALSGRPLEADLSAFFVHSGLINDQCPASVYAYYSRSEYQADSYGGYTAGSVALTMSEGQSNLAVDTGDVTPGTYNIKSQFNFNF
jgi:hypothetical protein